VQVEIGLNPIETMEGNVVLASIIDITERKMQEDMLKKQAELEIKNKELEQFAYIASHDLQEPLRTVSNYMQVFEEDYVDQLDGQARKYLQSVNNATKRMSMLIKALLDYSRLGRNGVLVHKNLRTLLDEVLGDLETIIRKSNAQIDIGEMPVLTVYETEMRQLFQNLITNAIKFTAADVTPHITIDAEQKNNSYVFRVADNGIGIDPVFYERVFEIFQRLHPADEYKGNGIGLAYCKKIVELHRGEIWIKSKPGNGSAFYFTISSFLK
jgi:light-regulated signal transduction histidine kinase (bacteriophytochrome)